MRTLPNNSPSTSVIYLGLIVVLLSVIGLGLYTTSYQPVTQTTELSDADIQKIYTDIVKQSKIQRLAPKLIIRNENIDNAYTNGYEIVLYRGIIKTAGSKDGVAVVLGHELSHVLLNHLNPYNNVLTPQEKEFQADQYGAILAQRAGYNICAGKAIWEKMREKYGDSIESTHPTDSTRADGFDFPQCAGAN